MQNFHNDNQDSRGGRGRKPFGDRNSGPREMHDAVCAECGNHCQVPFMPSQGKPVYCSNCFEKVQADRDAGMPPRRSFMDRNGADRSRSDHSHFDKPRYDKPNYSRPTAPAAPTISKEEFNQKFDQLNEKLDMILHSLTHPTQE